MKLVEKVLAMSFDQNQYFDLIGASSSLKDKVNTTLSREAKLILYYIHLYDKSNMGDLSKAFSMPNSTANFIVTKLIKEDLIVVSKQKKDHRVREISLTEKGHALIVSMIEFLNESLHSIFGMIIKNVDEELHSDFDETERKTIERFIELAIRKST